MNCRDSGAYIMAFYYLQSALSATYSRDTNPNEKIKNLCSEYKALQLHKTKFVSIYCLSIQMYSVNSRRIHWKSLHFACLFSVRSTGMQLPVTWIWSHQESEQVSLCSCYLDGSRKLFLVGRCFCRAFPRPAQEENVVFHPCFCYFCKNSQSRLVVLFLSNMGLGHHAG